MMKKKIAIIIQTLLSGGAEKQSVYLAKTLSEDFDVSLIILKGNSVERKFLEIIRNDSVKLIRLSGGLVKNMLSVYNIFRKEKIDITFSYLASGNFINGIIGSVSGVPYRVGGIRNAELSKKKLAVERWVHNHLLSKTVSNSFSAVEGLSKLGFNAKKFYVIHNAFELKEAGIIRNQQDTINILSVARFVPQKDYFTAIQAIKILIGWLKDSHHTFKYYLVGYGKQEQAIRDKVTELNLDEHIRIVIKPDNLDAYFKKADIFLSTSLFEGLSNSVMEALSFSLPVVATPAGDMEYLVKQDENGFLCEMKNPQDIASKLSVLINDYELRKKMGLKSYEIIAQIFSMDIFKQKYISFINNMTEKI